MQELTLGVTRRLGARGLARVDGVYRDLRLASTRCDQDTTTGQVADQFGRSVRPRHLRERRRAARARRTAASTSSSATAPHDTLNLGRQLHALANVRQLRRRDGRVGPGRVVDPELPGVLPTCLGSCRTGGLACSPTCATELRLYGDLAPARCRSRGQPRPRRAVHLQQRCALRLATTGHDRPAAVRQQPRLRERPAPRRPTGSSRATSSGWTRCTACDLSLNWARGSASARRSCSSAGASLNVFNRDGLTNATGGQERGGEAGCGTGGCIDTTDPHEPQRQHARALRPVHRDAGRGRELDEGRGVRHSRRAASPTSTRARSDMSFGIRCSDALVLTPPGSPRQREPTRTPAGRRAPPGPGATSLRVGAHHLVDAAPAPRTRPEREQQRRQRSPGPRRSPGSARPRGDTRPPPRRDARAARARPPRSASRFSTASIPELAGPPLGLLHARQGAGEIAARDPHLGPDEPRRRLRVAPVERRVRLATGVVEPRPRARATRALSSRASAGTARRARPPLRFGQLPALAAGRSRAASTHLRQLQPAAESACSKARPPRPAALSRAAIARAGSTPRRSPAARAPPRRAPRRPRRAGAGRRGGSPRAIRSSARQLSRGFGQRRRAAIAHRADVAERRQPLGRGGVDHDGHRLAARAFVSISARSRARAAGSRAPRRRSSRRGRSAGRRAPGRGPSM